MVHRPADSRLLANLLSQEKEYAKHLATLLDHSNASLASVTAYASASSPASAHLILSVAGSLAAADDALRHYAVAVDRWRDYLKGLKALEDEVGNIMRDREILVTRLIKASKPTLHSTHSSSSLPLSPTQSHSSLPFSSNNSTTNSKLMAAQTELQACEAHLAVKEAALKAHRAALVSDGLAGRCRALAECGQRWHEAGRAGVLSAQGSSNHPPRAQSDPNKPLPGVAGSDVSLAPSQSASQINLFVEPQQPQHIYSDAPLPAPSLDSSSNHHMVPLPPAHVMADHAAPLFPYARRALSHRITEENLLQTDEEGEGSSVAEEEEPSGPLKVVENPRFAAGTKGGAGAILKREGTTKREGTLQRREPTGTLRRESTYGSSTLSVPVKSSSGFFGSIRGLFGRRGGSDLGARTSGKRRWGKGKVVDDADISEPDVLSEPTPMPPRARVVSDVGSRRRRGMANDGARKAEEWVGGQGLLLAQHPDVEEKGRKKSKGKGKGTGTVHSAESTLRSIGNSAASDSTAEVLVVSPRQKRRASLGVTGNSASAEALVPSVPSGAKTTTRSERRASVPVHPAPRVGTETVSLMSIVEGVARANRDGWAAHNNNASGIVGASANAAGSTGGSGGLVAVKAPRPDVSTQRGRTVSVGATIDGLPRAPGSLFLPSASAYTTPAVPASFLGPEMAGGSGTSSPTSLSPASSLKRPAKSPLRSALRTTSPPPAPVPPLIPVKAPPPALVPVPIPVPAPILNGIGNTNGKGKEKAVESAEQGKGDDSDDAASISSYETGHEAFDEDGDETEHEEDHGKPPPPPPHEYGNGTVLHDSPIEHNNLIEDYGYGGSDLSASSASTPTDGARAVPQRRKSVRVSLQPTFSTTPPAIEDDTEDDEGGGGRHAPWGRSSPPDMWEDSSEEDVEYQKAKKLLNRISRKEKKNH
ncbi:hypothetical protein MVEN_02366300 [Mycena venus]|uniref:Uncharacterized protein n=1 Tax=Mycena venus TaxID=2733690 RepID=A0A8H6X3G9_9AGAR|nr:hypothetical protein MVEN_02366300 [Mycena venus]